MLVLPLGLLNYSLPVLALFLLFPAGIPGPLILISLHVQKKENPSGNKNAVCSWEGGRVL